ncbi:MAG: hypothetical protein ACFB02_09715 [Mastigocoleus sp.]
MLSEQLQTAITTSQQQYSEVLDSVNKPLAIIINASGKETVAVGTSFYLSVTVCNKGNQSAVIEVYIQEESPGVRSWCKSGQKLLALGEGQSEEVVFEFEIPPDALIGTHTYSIVVDAPEDYPEHTPIQYPQYFQVLPSTSDIVVSSDPTFGLQPTTTSTFPSIVPHGGAIAVQVLVHNRGECVDRFRVVCSDLPDKWLTINYPQGFQESGLLLDSECLNLNPGDRGQVSLLISPPMNALAGNYIATIRLYSENNPELTLLDLIYLQIPPNYLLQSDFRTLLGRIKKKSGLFKINLTNHGNTSRLVNLKVQDLEEEEICKYHLESSQTLIPPQKAVDINLKVEPTKWWKRPLFGGAKVINFSLDVEDAQELPLVNKNFPGTLIWEARPWWQLLPFILLLLLSIGASVYLVWWFLFRTPPSPKVFEFYPEDSYYSAENNDVVHLGFSINNPQRIKSIKMVGMSADGEILTRPETYDFSNGVPINLKPYCNQNQQILNCNRVRSNARKPDTYVFEMTVLPKSGKGTKPVTFKTSPVTIVPIPRPEIISFGSTRPIYQEVSYIFPESSKTSRRQDKRKNKRKNKRNNQKINSQIKLNWALTNPNQLQSIQIIGRTPEGLVTSPLKTYNFSQGIPPELQGYCRSGKPLVCLNVNTRVQKPGNYIFEIIAIPKGKVSDKVATKKTDLIKILPKPSRILDFKINGNTAPAKYLIPIVDQKKSPKVNIFWKVDASVGAKVELLPAPGTIPLSGSIPLILEPEPTDLTLRLQVTSPTGQQVSRSVILTTYDPNAKDPAVVAAEALKEAMIESQKQTSEKVPGAIPQQTSQTNQAGVDSTQNQTGEKKSSDQNNPAPSVNSPAELQILIDEEAYENQSPKNKKAPSLKPVEIPPQIDK